MKLTTKTFKRNIKFPHETLDILKRFKSLHA